MLDKLQSHLLKWPKELQEEFDKPYIKKLDTLLVQDSADLCPNKQDIFRAYEAVPFNAVKVVILGLDPYINGEACGMSFSCQTGKVPPSLRVIFNELLKSGLSIKKRTNGDLTDWANQGVFLLNTILTTTRGRTLAHAKYGWQEFTGTTLRLLAQNPNPIVFMAWGEHAKSSISKYVTPYLSTKKLVIKNCHPAAELYGRMRFTDSGDFLEVNKFLTLNNLEPIVWDTE